MTMMRPAAAAAVGAKLVTPSGTAVSQVMALLQAIFKDTAVSRHAAAAPAFGPEFF